MKRFSSDRVPGLPGTQVDPFCCCVGGIFQQQGEEKPKEEGRKEGRKSLFGKMYVISCYL